MENFINSVGIEKIILFVLIFNVVLLIGFIINTIKTNAISKKYKNFMQKLGEGKNIEEDLENYMYKVERVEKQNIEIAKFIEQLDKDFEGDAISPKINENTWEEISREVGPDDGLNDFGYEYITYKRRD